MRENACHASASTNDPIPPTADLPIDVTVHHPFIGDAEGKLVTIEPSRGNAYEIEFCNGQKGWYRRHQFTVPAEPVAGPKAG